MEKLKSAISNVDSSHNYNVTHAFLKPNRWYHPSLTTSKNKKCVLISPRGRLNWPVNFPQIFIKSMRSKEILTIYWSTDALSSSLNKNQFLLRGNFISSFLNYILNKISNHIDLQTEDASLPSEWQCNFEVLI